ncbi:PREDICTED: zona pellucida sperm-binding protein 3 receptor-like isoform X1 [Thamnophis sirtalis]|uniref:Zona pellucida sperm-binding protein 3 receptor-like isoform X1 n=1 Tax=Thamnophis sirtalis TaxID=35019 RepID=A0A6I9X6I7_9SAUR|nr:PREDICTED: zona pellucida sperm-binding protein 3 receptor-like isoform X1 [Thamnophis sirtalis]
MAAFPCSQTGLLAWMLLLLLLSSSEVQSECQTPVLPPNSSPRGGGDLAQSYPIGTVLRLQCDPGYTPKSGTIRSMTCLDTNKWSELPTLCERRRCTTPSIDFGNMESTDGLLLGDKVTFSCNEGYILIGSPTLRCVLRFGKVDWDRSLPYCKSIFCTSPPLIANGDYEGGSSGEYHVFSAVTYWCKAGYSLIGQSTIACKVAENGRDGIWDSSPPECKKVKCLRPNIPNGRMPYGSRETYTYQHSIFIECSPGFTLVGSSTIYCDANSEWNPSVPQCVKN